MHVNANLVIRRSSIVFSVNNELEIADTGHVDLVYWNDECILDMTGEDCSKIEVICILYLEKYGLDWDETESDVLIFDVSSRYMITACYKLPREPTGLPGHQRMYI